VAPASYLIAYALAAANLRMRGVVVVDSVDPVAVTRDARRRVAVTASAEIIEIEVVCSGKTGDRRSVATRSVDVPGLALPLWQDVVEHDYELWDRPRIVLDTAGSTILETLKELRMRMSNIRFRGAQRVRR
jgi:hypothetical protein